MLPLQGAQVPFMVWELTSCKPHCVAKKTKNKKKLSVSEIEHVYKFKSNLYFIFCDLYGISFAHFLNCCFEPFIHV